MKSVLMATTEFSPYVKSGGLGDVAGSLPHALRKEGVDVRVIMPLYRFLPSQLMDRMKFVKEFYVYLGWRRQYAGVYELDNDGLPMYFIDSLFYFGGDQLYYDMENDIERFAFFCNAVLSAMPHIDFAPDVLHCHDWHTSLAPILLNAHFKKMQFYSGVKTVMTIHNLKYQGICNKYKLYDVLGINDSFSVAGHLEFGYDLVNCLKGGLSIADKITTVSETYASEIRYPFFGEGLDWLMRWRGADLVGILNGIDTESYDPATDKAIAANYAGAPEGADAAALQETIEKKRENKLALQAELGLTQDASVPMVGVISRLFEQKGIDLITRVFEEMLATEQMQFVLLGTGEGYYEGFFRDRAQWYQGKVAATIGFNEKLSRQIYAGSDFFLMPSRFEPCGISQMLAMRYGSLPIVRETGGLRDTVAPYNEVTGEGCGYSFANYNAHEMLGVIRHALHVYRDDPQAHARLVQAAMARDYSWKASAQKYIALYENL
jgi:starch synthase